MIWAWLILYLLVGIVGAIAVCACEDDDEDPIRIGFEFICTLLAWPCVLMAITIMFVLWLAGYMVLKIIRKFHR